MLLQAEYEFILSRDLMSIIERSFREVAPQTPFVPGPHLEVIAAKLEACRQGKIKRLIINMPPRNLKSICASVAFPAWYLGHNPTGHIICATYGQDLSDKFARDCRNVMMSSWYKRLFSTRIGERHAVWDFQTTEQGTRMATSVGGVLTGRGADLLIIDDPLKPDEALSETRRKAVNEWYNGTLLSRLNSKSDGCIILVMQRLHQDDLVGHVLEQENWEVLSFPAIASEDETFSIDTLFGPYVYARRAGEALHPERETLTTLANIQKTIGDYNFTSQYLQNPSPPGGAMIKTEWLKYYEEYERPVKFNEVVQSWDTANKATELSDYSVCTTWGVISKVCYLLDVYRGRLNFPDLKRKVRELAKSRKPHTILIEDKASGTQLIQDLKDEGVFGVKPFEPLPGNDKIIRLHSQSAMFEGGNVRLPCNAPWLSEYVRELTGFPGTRYDDQVDSTTQALIYLREFATLDIWARL